MDVNALVREPEHEFITFAEATEAYGIPRTFLLRWKRNGILTDLSGLVSRHGRAMINRQIFETVFHLVPVKRPKAPKAHRNGVGHLH